ncbi:MAG: penicillin-binding protein [Bacteroidetes bacterium]|nr:penicillin-binding protein [Bacteroidota bacterium]
MFETLRSKLSDVYNRLPDWVHKIFSFVLKITRKIFFPSVYNFKRFRTLSWLRKTGSLIYSFFLTIVLFLLAMEMNFLYLFGYLPSMQEVRNPRIPLISEVYTNDNVLIGTYSLEKRDPVIFEEIDSNTIKALIATEDVRFYKHHGLDLYALFSAAFSTMTGDKRGGSTITNQLVKNVYKTRQRNRVGLLGRIPLIRTLIAKTKEWVTALKIEMVYSKNEILTMYFNAVEFGNNTFGLKMASQFYFSKDPQKLKLEESAMLVGILKGPGYYNPKTQYERVFNRRNTVLAQMSKYQFIDSTTFKKVSLKPMKFKFKKVIKEESLAPWFQNAVARDLKSWCEERGLNIYIDGLKIKTTLNSKMQKHAEKAIAENMVNIQQTFQWGLGGEKYWYDRQIARERAELKDKTNPTPTEKRFNNLLKQTSAYRDCINSGMTESQAFEQLRIPHKVQITQNGYQPKATVKISTSDSLKHMLQIFQSGLVSIDPVTGAIKAWVGGVHPDVFQFDHVDQAKRQPGSAFKPIVYATALERGMDPCQTFVDEPIELDVLTDGKPDKWAPQNSSKSFSNRPYRLRSALTYSTNTIAVKVMMETGIKNVIKMAEKLGIESKLEELPSLALGSSEMTLLELTRAYLPFANGGKAIRAHLVESIEDSRGKEIYNMEDESEEQQAMSKSTAYTMSFFLRGPVEDPQGTAHRLFSYGICKDNEMGGKTGTTSDYIDGWFVGVTHNLVTGVWVGADDTRIHFETGMGMGGRTALPIYGRYMQLIYGDASCGIAKGEFHKPSDYDQNISCYPNFKQMDETPQDTVQIEIDTSALEELEEELGDMELIPVPESPESQPEEDNDNNLN